MKMANKKEDFGMVNFWNFMEPTHSWDPFLPLKYYYFNEIY